MNDTPSKIKEKSKNIEKLDFSKIKHENKGFTTYLNVVVQNIYDPIALALWCYLASLPPEWKINKSQLRSHFKIGREKLDKALTVLKSLDLLRFERERHVDGTLGDSAILVMAGHEFNQNTAFQYLGAQGAKNKDSHQDTEKPESGLPGAGKPTPINKTEHKTKTKKKETKSFFGQNAKKHDFAESMDQMANEKKHIEEHEKIKRAPMPQTIRDILGIKRK